MIDFSQVTDITYNGTTVEQITDSLGNVLWSSAVDPSTQYFYVEDLSGSNNTLSITKSASGAPTIEVFASTDQQNWSSIGTTSTTAITATVPANSKLYLKVTTNAWKISGSSGGQNVITAADRHNVGGNIMSLLYGDNFMNTTVFPSSNEYIFDNLFNANEKLVSAENLILPATTLTRGCYEGMFRACKILTTPPALPATTLANNCYQAMFYQCYALTTAPALPATTLANNCYNGIFQGCTSLTTAPVLPATTLVNNCYQYMFYGCTTLTTAPALPARTLANNCYREMFRNCTALNKVTTYASNISASSCLKNWVSDVSATGDFYNLGGATYPSGASGIPSGWTEHTSL